MYLLAWRYGLDFNQLAQWNGLRSPYTLSAGQSLRLNPPPANTLSVMRARKQVVKSSTPKPALSARRPQQLSYPSAISGNKPQVSHKPLNNEPPAWFWPLQGDVIRKFSPNESGKKGIDIAGIPGQSIKAASTGRVVYSGSGLLGYGQLIIIKHNPKFLSAYAHNRRLVDREGEQVESGQKIAELGMSGTDRPKLHFEIRRNGKPVDPLRYLPKRE